MNSRTRMIKAAVAALAMTPLTGCVSSTQLFDFGRTEIARVAADLVGQFFLIFVQAISPFGAA